MKDNCKQIYSEPRAEIVRLAAVDFLTASGGFPGDGDDLDS